MNHDNMSILSLIANASLLVQLVMMRRFLAEPVGRALWYSGFGVPLFVAGMMVSAFALRGLIQAGA